MAAVVYPYSQGVGALSQIWRHIIHKGDISIGAFTQQMSVEVYLAAVVYSFEIDIVAQGGSGNIEMLAIAPYACWQITSATGQRGRWYALYRPVVWQREVSP